MFSSRFISLVFSPSSCFESKMSKYKYSAFQPLTFKNTMSAFLDIIRNKYARGGGGGVLDQYLGIDVPLRV